jgi:hypothetical protein
VLLAVARTAVVQRLVPLSIRQSRNDATGIIYAALYVMFGVTIGLSLYLVWQQYDTAQKTAEGEAAHLKDLYRLARSLPEPERGEVQTSPPPTSGSWWRRSGPRWRRDGRAHARRRSRPSSGAASRTSGHARKPNRRSRARD